MKMLNVAKLSRVFERATFYKRRPIVDGTELDCLTTVAERRTLSGLLTILDNDHHPLHSTLNRQRSAFSGRLLSLSCSSERLRKSFVPRGIQLYNAMQKGRGREMDFSAGVYLSLPSPAHLISSQPHAQTLPPTYSALSLCSLHFPNTHKHNNTIFALSTQAQEHYIFALSTPAAQEHFSPGHRHCHNHCILYHRVRPILVSVNTPTPFE